jgi:hypothetical protein
VHQSEPMNKPLTTEPRSVTVHPGGLDQSLRFTVPDLDGAYYWLDGVLYFNSDHERAAELRFNEPRLPAINQAAFDRLQELTETNRRMRSELRECADAYQRGYSQGIADAAAQTVEHGVAGGNRTRGAGV